MNDPIKEHLIKLYDQQEEKGLKKYGHTLSECPDDKYDMNLMALEEAVDLAKYVIKENMVLKRKYGQAIKKLSYMQSYKRGEK